MSPGDVPNIAQQQIKMLSEQLAIVKAQRDEAREGLAKCKHDLKRVEHSLTELRKQHDS